MVLFAPLTASKKPLNSELFGAEYGLFVPLAISEKLPNSELLTLKCGLFGHSDDFREIAEF